MVSTLFVNCVDFLASKTRESAGDGNAVNHDSAIWHSWDVIWLVYIFQVLQ